MGVTPALQDPETSMAEEEQRRCEHCGRAAAHSDPVLANRCVLVQGLLGDPGGQKPKQGLGEKKTKRKKAKKVKKNVKDTSVERSIYFSCEDMLVEQEVTTSGSGEGKDIEDFMDKVTDILRDRRKGAWVGWVERQYEREEGRSLPKGWVNTMEEQGKIRRDQAGVVTMDTMDTMEEQGKIRRDQAGVVTMDTTEEQGRIRRDQAGMVTMITMEEQGRIRRDQEGVVPGKVGNANDDTESKVKSNGTGDVGRHGGRCGGRGGRRPGWLQELMMT